MCARWALGARWKSFHTSRGKNHLSAFKFSSLDNFSTQILFEAVRRNFFSADYVNARCVLRAGWTLSLTFPHFSTHMKSRGGALCCLLIYSLKKIFYYSHENTSWVCFNLTLHIRDYMFPFFSLAHSLSLSALGIIIIIIVFSHRKFSARPFYYTKGAELLAKF